VQYQLALALRLYLTGVRSSAGTLRIVSLQ
jgi:hypothetical protein